MRIVAHQKNALEGKGNERFSGLADYVEDLDDNVENVIGTVKDDFAEEIKVNAIVSTRMTPFTMTPEPLTTSSTNMNSSTTMPCSSLHWQCMVSE